MQNNILTVLKSAVTYEQAKRAVCLASLISIFDLNTNVCPVFLSHVFFWKSVAAYLNQVAFSLLCLLAIIH